MSFLMVARLFSGDTMHDWWTIERVAYYLPRYGGIRATLRNYAPDIPQYEGAVSAGGHKYEQRFCHLVAIVADLDRAIDRLPVKHRKVADMYWRRGRTQEGIADRTGVTQQWVSQLLVQCEGLISGFLCH